MFNTIIQAGREAESQIVRQIVRQAGRQADRQAGRHKCKYKQNAMIGLSEFLASANDQGMVHHNGITSLRVVVGGRLSSIH